MRWLYLKVVYWLADYAFYIHELLYDVASRPARAAHNKAIAYGSFAFTHEVIAQVDEHELAADERGESFKRLRQMRIELASLYQEQRTRKNKETEAA